MSFAKDESWRNSFGISYEFRNLFRRTDSLLSAAKQGDTINLGIYLRYGAYIESRDMLGYSILSLAASSGHIEAVRMLLDKGAAISGVNNSDHEPLIGSSYTALEGAASNNHAEIIKLLLDRGAAVDTWCYTLAIHAAGLSGHVHIVALLFDNFSDVSSETKAALHCSTRSVLYSAASRGDEAIVQMVLDRLPSPEEAMECINHILNVTGCTKDIFRLLLDRGGEIRADANGKTALHQVSGAGHLEVVRLLLDRGAVINSVDQERNTPLIIAAAEGHTDVVQLLLDCGADIDSVNQRGHTALMVATLGRHLEIVRILLARGASLEIQNRRRHTALIMASCGSNAEVVSEILVKLFSTNPAYECDVSALCGAAAYGHIETVKLLLDNGASIDIVSRRGVTPLNLSAKHGHLDVMKLLLDRGAVESNSPVIQSALIQSARYGQVEVVKYLLDSGAEVDCVDGNGTPLIAAAAGAHVDVVKLLLDRGAVIESVDSRGRTALKVAAAGDGSGNDNGNDRVVELLLSRGAMIDKVDIRGATALMAAVENAHFQAHTVKILLINGADISIRSNNGETAYNLIQSRVDDTTKYLKYALASRFYFVRFHHMGEMKRHEYKDTGDTGYDYDEFDRI